MAELEKSNTALGKVTAVQTQTTNVHGDTIQTVTTTNYEQQVFSSKSDLRARAISATYLPFVSNISMPPTMMLRMMQLHLRIQVAAFLYGVSPPDNKQVKEIKAVVWVPQRGSNNSVELLNKLPKDDSLKDLEPLGGAPRQSVSPLPSLLVQSRYLLIGFQWGRKNVDNSANPPGFNPNMSERVQLLLSDRILGMTLVPEGKVWNYGIGLTQL
ncbi:hypothetical protein EDB19DRAFT_2036719 [Suillus lakei]|nr:hypothetical protein EDB19DRAFT_2036719 [Suillus lakei]